MQYLLAITEKVVFIILVMGSGILAKRMKLLSDTGEKDLSMLMVDLVWPSLIFSSITTTLTPRDIIANIYLPLLSVGLHLVGLVLGLFFCRIAGYAGDRRKIFLFHASMNNFLVMALPFASFFFPEKGAALLTVANLGSIIFLWTAGAIVVSGKFSVRENLMMVVNPCLVSTVVAIVFVFTGLNRYVPRILNDGLAVLGQPTLLFGLLMAGTQIYKLGWKALKFDAWNISVALLRNFLVPGVLFLAALLLRGRLSRETLVIFMVIGSTPVSVNSITLAFKYKSSPELAAEGVLMTHIVAVVSMTAYVSLIKLYLS